MKLASLRKHAWWVIPLVVLVIGVGNWVINEVIVLVHLSRLDATTTRQEVIERLGEPDWEIPWSGSHGAGDIFVYRYPYFWDYLLPLRETRSIEVHFLEGDEQLIEVLSHRAYEDSRAVVISRGVRR